MNKYVFTPTAHYPHTQAAMQSGSVPLAKKMVRAYARLFSHAPKVIFSCVCASMWVCVGVWVCK
jgi:hypothetical protein